MPAAALAPVRPEPRAPGWGPGSRVGPPPTPQPPPSAPPPPWLRSAVRNVLADSPSYHTLPAADRRALAHAMVRVGQLAAETIAQERAADAEIARAQALAAAPADTLALAGALSEQPGFGESARRIGQISRDTLEAISFPRFVTDLLNGVFRAMNDSSQAQMQQFLQLLNAVSSSAAGFEQTQTSELQVRAWLVDHFPDAFEMDLPDAPDSAPDSAPDPDDWASAPGDAEPPELRLIDGASMPTEERLRAALGVQPGQSFSASTPEALVPLARRQLARQRQQMLATMVQMGMQRIVIDAGKINAAMRFHIDTRSAANQDRGSQNSFQNRVRAGGGFSIGPWGASADVENTISFVSTRRDQRSEEINTSADLNSSVELHFHTDAVPLNRLAARAQADRIRNASLNPDHEAGAEASRAHNERVAGARTAETARRGAIDSAVTAVTPPALSTEPLRLPQPSPAGAAGTDAPAATRTDAPASGSTGAPTAAPAPDPAPAAAPAPASAP